MLPLNYGDVYKTPDNYQPPDEAELSEDRQYPNLNSRDYARRPLNHTAHMYEAWECVAVNPSTIDFCGSASGNVIVCCNKLRGREWTGSLWAFEMCDVLKCRGDLAKEMSSFKLQSDALISGFQYVTTDNFLLALNTGKLQLWSSRSRVLNSDNPYYLFMMSEQCQHQKPIISLTSFQSNSQKAITGSKDGDLKIWDINDSVLCLKQSYNFAHIDSITGLTTSPTNDNIFVSCSLDKSCLLWDNRKTRPAIALYEGYDIRFRCVCWSSSSTDIIYVGDESGYLSSVDIRKPFHWIKQKRYFERGIHKIKAKGDNYAIIADTNVVKIINCLDQERIIYENTSGKNILRDCAWLSAELLMAVGFEGKLILHEIIL